MKYTGFRKLFLSAALALGLVGGGFVASGYATQVINDVLSVAGLNPAIGTTASARNFNTCGSGAQLAADGNDSTPATTSLYVAEVFVPQRVTVTGIAMFNGSAGTDARVGSLYDSSGYRIAATGAEAAGTNDTYQRLPFSTAVTINGPATYYVGLQFAGTTARFNTFAVGNCGAGQITGQTYGTVPTSITPPTTFTTALGPIAALY